MYRPHTPFVAPKKYFDMYNRDSIQISYDGSSDEYLKTIPKSAASSIRWKKDQIALNLKSNKKLAQEIKEAYFATTTFVDAQIGRILKKLKQTGLDKNTIVVFTSDHGYHLGEHGHWQKQTLFENSTRVPLIFSGPGLERNVRIENSPVELIDIYPTLMDLTGIETPDHVVGKSLKPIFENNNIKIRNSALTKWRNGYSIKTENFRITKWKKSDEVEYELYDHSNDKEELRNLVNNPNYSTLFDSLKIELELRIADAKLKPKGVGRQFEQESYRKAPNLTQGDIYNKNGDRVYFKPINE
jgi:arylsulfatase A-like enzyme